MKKDAVFFQKAIIAYANIYYKNNFDNKITFLTFERGIFIQNMKIGSAKKVKNEKQ